MKKYFILPMCIAMFATFASCDKNEVEVISNGEREVTIHATIDPSTKTEYTDDKLFTWQLTDVLRVFSTNSSLDPTYKWDKFTASSVSGSSAEFTGKITSGYTPYEVLCPGAANYGKNGDGSAIGTIILSKALDYTSVIGSNLPLYAKVPDGVNFEDAELVFRPVCGLIKVTYNNAPLTAGKFVITSKDSPLAGTFQLSEGLISGIGAKSTSNSVTVSFNQLDENGKLEFFIPAVATTYGSGLSIELQTPDGVTIEGTQKKSQKELEVVNGRFSRTSVTLPDIASVYITTPSTTLEASATSFDIDFCASSSWTASSSKDNFKLSSTSGTAGHKTITVSFPANTSADEVASTITIISGSDKKSITVTQESGLAKKYTLDSEAIKKAHSESWTYTSGKKDITASDGSAWIAYNTFASANQITIQMNKGKGAYILTPEVTGRITKIAIENVSAAAGTGTGTRPIDVLSADGKTTVLENVSGESLTSGKEITGNYSQLKIICDETSGGATYIKSITVYYE